MVEPFNTADDLQARLGFLGPNQDQFDLTDRLLDATLELEAMIGRSVQELLTPSFDDQREFRLTYSNVFEVIRIEIVSPHGTHPETVDSSDFTLTHSPERGNQQQLVFDQVFAEDQLFNEDYRLRIVYIPELYRRLELRLAELDIASLASVQTGDDQTAARAEKAMDRMDALMKRINRTEQNLADPDTGRNLSPNFNYPGDRF
jgi:hypothetical protein